MGNTSKDDGEWVRKGPVRLPDTEMLIANQLDIVVVDKAQRKAVVVDNAIPNDGNIRKKEHEKSMRNTKA